VLLLKHVYTLPTPNFFPKISFSYSLSTSARETFDTAKLKYWMSRIGIAEKVDYEKIIIVLVDFVPWILLQYENQ